MLFRSISDSAYDYQQAIESGKMPIVGLNCYRAEDEKLPMDLFQVPETLRIQEERIKKIKKERDPLRAQHALYEISRCCDENGNLMEVIVESVKAYVTEGEISRTIKGCYRTWNTPLF